MSDPLRRGSPSLTVGLPSLSSPVTAKHQHFDSSLFSASVGKNLSSGISIHWVCVCLQSGCKQGCIFTVATFMGLSSTVYSPPLMCFFVYFFRYFFVSFTRNSYSTITTTMWQCIWAKKTFREHSKSTQRTHQEHSKNTPRALRENSKSTQRTLREHSWAHLQPFFPKEH